MRFQMLTGLWIFVAMIYWPGDRTRRAAADEWQDAVRFTLPTEAITNRRVTKAADWIRSHTVRVQRPGDKGVIPTIAWNDPTLQPGNPRVLAGYVITDTLWAAKAIKPIDKNASLEMEEGLRSLGWYGNGLHDVLFHRLDTILHCPADEDVVHGHSLGRFPIPHNRTVDLRVFRQKWDPSFDVGHPQLFAEHAVYRALHDFWNGRKDQARLRLKHAIERSTDPQDQIFWDGHTRVLVDFVNRAEWLSFSQGEVPTCRHYTFKLGVLLYAVRLMGMEGEVPLASMKERLWSGQLENGGVSHFLDVRHDGAAIPGLDATGEASAIAILVETIEPAER